MPEGVTGTPYERGWSIVGLKGKREAAHRAGRRPHLGFLVGLGLGGAPPLLVLIVLGEGGRHAALMGSPFTFPLRPMKAHMAPGGFR